MANTPVELRVNGRAVQVEVDEEMSLLTVLREHLDLTGSKYGCAEGECGACTVVLDGRAARSCITPARAALGREVLTIEGLEQGGELHPLQQAFLDHEAFQCGYCTPGMIMSALALLKACPDPGDQDVVAAMQGNICRCGTYHRITRAVRQAAAVLLSRGAEAAEGEKGAEKSRKAAV
ncbi:MAG TPA: (2Fe-2S)-binding protein [Chloroflexia bacterium]|jgi:aerobic-type carbon monoxide dehydrogenase small subunit (CoxS/CutS family)|nr:(2Fe-2S)-binding protein [Chloroflexia bacterium]